MSKRDVSASVNMCKPSCFRDGVTCLRNVSVCGFLLFRPVPRIVSKAVVHSGESHSLRNSRLSDIGRAVLWMARDARRRGDARSSHARSSHARSSHAGSSQARSSHERSGR